MAPPHLLYPAAPLQQMLVSMFKIIIFEDCRNQWSLSRPMLALILLHPNHFDMVRDVLATATLLAGPRRSR